jgi:hypothetical protein
MIAAAPAALEAQGSQLPLRTSGVEHVGFTVPDLQKSAAFYGRIFDPQIFQEMMRRSACPSPKPRGTPVLRKYSARDQNRHDLEPDRAVGETG